MLAGADFDACRPLVIIAEGPAEPAEWEAALLGNRYDFVVYDGVNRWFACSTRPDLGKLLKPPISAHDNYVNVDQYGSPFSSLMHPEQRWSAVFGQSMLKAVRTLNPGVITAAYLERIPQHVQERRALPSHYASAVRVVLGRRANEQELECFGQRQPTPTIKQVYEELIFSDEFLGHRGRAIASF